VNFAQFYKQKGVKVMRIHIAELIELIKQKERKQLIDELPTRLIEILDLTEKSFRHLINGNYIIKEACKVFPNYFYCFLKENLWTINTEFLCCKVMDTDIEKFIKGKPTLTKDNII
jgi:hypothetical protein